MLIYGERIYLGLISSEDAPIVMQWMNEIEIRRLFFTECPFPIDLTSTQNWINLMNSGPQTRLLSIHRIDGDELIGMFTIRKLSWVSRSVRFGSMLWPPQIWNQGLGTEARKIFLEYVYKQLGMRRVYGNYAAYNIASQKSHQKLGAATTAQNRDAVYIDGCFHDQYHYTYLKERYPGLESSIENTPLIKIAGSDAVSRDSERLFQDFYGLPSTYELAYRHWFKNKLSLTSKLGQVVFLMNDIRKSADLLLFPSSWERPALDLIKTAVEQGFNQYNLHRLQICLPASAVKWQDMLVAQKFKVEGRLDQVCYANGRYFDLIFLGRLAGD